VAEPAISIFTPTLGRQTLLQLAKDILPQLHSQDEWILVGDAPSPASRQMVESFQRENVRYYEMEPATGWGYPQREYAIRHARGTHLWGVDDDDRVAPWALETIRRVAGEHPCRPLMFRVIYSGLPIWRNRLPALMLGNVSNQNFITPNIKERLGQWGKRYEGDFDFIVSTVELHPSGAKSIVWRPEVLLMQGLSIESDGYKRLVESWVWTRDIWMQQITPGI
jgi:glycosyltransferase involved in cell wall biosynthesis